MGRLAMCTLRTRCSPIICGEGVTERTIPSSASRKPAYVCVRRYGGPEVVYRRIVSGQVYSAGILHSQGNSAISGREMGMTSPHTNLYENASTAPHRRRRHLVAAALSLW